MTETCPNCGSLNIQKKGIRAGKRRFRCTSCGANFTEGVVYIKSKRLKPLKKTCPYCGNKKVIRRGTLDDGTKRYECTSCHLSFSNKTIAENRKTSKGKDLKCPYCGEHLVYSGKNRNNGSQRFYCNSCNRSCSADKNGNPVIRESFTSTNTSVECPRCRSLNVIKSGYGSTNKPRYKCKDCGKMFTENPDKAPHSKDEEQQAISKVLLGYPVEKVAIEFGYSLERLKRVLRPWYRKEQITKQQKKDIIKFGYYLKVPVNYMAEYVKCSERKCLDTIKDFKKALMSTNHDAT
jgi:transposase-like protein